MSQEPVKILQISDLHLFAKGNGELLGVNTRASFDAVIKDVKARFKHIDLILLTGDISQDASVASYEYASQVLQTFKVPVYSVPGNHDDPKVMDRLFPHEMMLGDKQLEIGNWQIILLNSHKHGSVEGFLAPEEMKFLENALEKNKNKYSIITFHHQPLPVGSAWLDNLGVENTEAFWKLLKKFPNVKAIFYGHVHQENETVKQGIDCYSVPSTCFQFKGDQDWFGLENIPPGYRWIELYKDGTIKTGVNRIARYIGTFMPDAKGY